MYKGLSLAILAALISYSYLLLFPTASLQQLTSALSNATSSLVWKPTYNYNATEMALSSVSRRVVQKVLSVETPEVRV